MSTSPHVEPPLVPMGGRAPLTTRVYLPPTSGGHFPAGARDRRASPYALQRALDTGVALLCLIGILYAFNALRAPQDVERFLQQRLSVKNALLLAGFLYGWPLLLESFGLYNPTRRHGFRSETMRVVLACGVGSLAALVFPLTSNSPVFGVEVILAFMIAVTASTLFTRNLGHALSPSAPRDEHQVLIVGSGPRARALYHQLRRRDVRVLGFVDSVALDADDDVGRRLLGALPELEDIVLRQPVHEVLVALPVRSHYEEIQRILHLCERVAVQATYLADVFSHGRVHRHYDDDGDFQLVRLTGGADDWRLSVKRSLDVVGAGGALLVLAPLLLAVAVAIRLTSPGPVLFAQVRCGLHRRPFRMYKFRTMVVDAEARMAQLESANEAQGPVFKIRNDPRVTRVGRFLRVTSIDELPQFWNVLLGDMSLVGPRPLPLRDVSRFAEADLLRRFSVVPGITGLWQVSGRSGLTFDDWIRLDLRYIDDWSLALDLRILAATIPAVVRGTGAA